MALLTSVHATPLSWISLSNYNHPSVKTTTCYKRLTLNSSSLSSSSPSPTDSNIHVSSTNTTSTTKVPSSNKPPPDKVVNYAVSSSGGSPVARFLRSTESNIERVSIKQHVLVGVLCLCLYVCCLIIRFYGYRPASAKIFVKMFSMTRGVFLFGTDIFITNVTIISLTHNHF